MIKDDLWVFGAGDLAALARYFFEQELSKKVSGFIVDDQFGVGASKKLGRILTWAQYLEEVSGESAQIFPAIGYRSMRAREAVFERLVASGHRICSLVCKTARVAANSEIGNGAFVMPGVVIEPGVVVGSNNVLWSNSTICHDSTLGAHNFIAANAVVGGRARVGSRCFLGFSSVVGQAVRVCDDVLIGAAAFVKDSVDEPGVYVGAPAVKRRRISPIVGVSVSP